MEWAQTKEIGTALSKLHVLSHNVDNVDAGQ